jgi:PKD repeat protein
MDGSGNVVVTGYFAGTTDFDPGAGTANLISAGSSDIFIAKYGALGNYVWAKGMGGTNVDRPYSLALDGSGNVFITGSFLGTVDFDPGSGTANRISAGNNDIFLAKYDASGNYLWAMGMGMSGTSDDWGKSLALDGSGNVVVTGFFYGTVDFDPGSGTANLTSAGGADIFLAKYNASGIYVWAKRMGGTGNEVGNSLDLDGSGNVLVTGFFGVNAGGTADFDPGAGTANLTSISAGANIFLAKYNASGDYVWAKGISNPSTSPNEPKSLALDGIGNVVVAGYFYGTVDFDPSEDNTANLVAGSNNGFISSYTSADGTYNSALLLGGYLLASDVTSSAIVKDGSGNLYVTGSFAGTADFDPGAGTASLTSAGGTDIFLAKYDVEGNYVWAKRMGGTSTEVGKSLALDGSGNVVVTGSFQGTADFDPSAGTANLTSAGGQYDSDIFLAKYDASGNYVWAKGIGGTGNEVGNSLASDGSGNVVVTGSFSSTADFDPGAGTASLTSAGGTDIFLANYDASGNYVWAKAIGTTNTDVGYSLALDASSNVVVTGSFNGIRDFVFNPFPQMISKSEIFLAKYNASGVNIWEKRIGGISEDVGYSLALDGTGNVVVTGSFQGTEDFDPGAGTANLTSAGSSDIFLAKYEAASGDYVWAKGIGGTGYDVVTSLALDGSGNVVVTGSFRGTADFDPGASTANLTSVGGEYDADIFLAKYNASGNYVLAIGMGGTGNDIGNSLTLDGSGNAVITGIFKATADFDPSAGTTNLTSMSGGQYGFIAAYGSSICTNPTAGGTIATAQSGYNPFTPAAFTSTVAASGESGTLEYKWQSSTTSNSASFEDIASSNAATYTAGALTVTTWFKRLARVSCSADWTEAVESNVLEVTVTNCTNPTPSISDGSLTTFCAGGNVVLTSSSATGNQWYKDGAEIGSATNQTYTATTAGSYTVIVTTSGCSSAASAGTIVTVNPIPTTPTINAGGLTTFCTGGSVVLTSSSAAGNQWYKDGSPISGETNQTYSATASGVYTVIVTTSNCSSMASTGTTVAVNANPVSLFTVNKANQPLTGNSFVFTNTSTGGATYQWNFGNGETATTQNATYSYSILGTYNVELKVTSASGCVSSSIQSVSVKLNFYPNTVDCQSYLTGEEPSLTKLCYSVSNGKVSGITPATFYYYTTITAPSSTFTMDVVQSVSSSLFKLFPVKTGTAKLLNNTCGTFISGNSPSSGQPQFKVTGAVAGRTYIISIVYETKSSIGAKSTSTEIPTFTFTAKVGTTVLANSTSSIKMYPNNCAGIVTSSEPILGDILTSAAPGLEVVDSKKQLLINAYPNPTRDVFDVIIKGTDYTTPGILRVLNMLGQIIEIRNGIRPGSKVQMGGNYLKGTYIVEYRQNGSRVHATLVKE